MKSTKKQYIKSLKSMHRLETYIKENGRETGMPYIQNCNEDIPSQVLRKSLKPIKLLLMNNKHYNDHDSRVLGFEELVHYDDYVTLYGIISNYRIMYHPRNKQASLYILLLNVYGISGDDGSYSDLTYLTDHVWVNVNNFKTVPGKQIKVAIGDLGIFCGKPHVYSGRLGDKHGYKFSLNDAMVLKDGYPLILKMTPESKKPGGLITPYMFPYQHEAKFIYTVYRKYGHLFLRLGNDITKYDHDKLSFHNYHLGNIPCLNIQQSINQARYHNVPESSTLYLSENHKFLFWNTNKKECTRCIPLTSASQAVNSRLDTTVRYVKHLLFNIFEVNP